MSEQVILTKIDRIIKAARQFHLDLLKILVGSFS